MNAAVLPRHSTLSPIARALGIQLLCALITLLGIQPLLDHWIPSMAAWFGAGICGALAAVLAHFIKLPRWWMLIQFSLPPLIVAAISYEWPSWLFMVGFVSLLGLSPRAAWGRVPLYLSRSQVAQLLSNEIPSQAHVVDIGCGPGGLITQLAAKREDLACTGVEIAPLTYLAAKLRALKNRNCEIELGSFWSSYWQDYNVIYAYLSPVPMRDVWQKACREMRAGSLVFSNEFAIPDVTPIKTWSLPNGTLFLYQVPLGNV